MKHVITHLKAPWPQGTKVGDVIELATVPVWAVGKVAPAPDDAEVTVSLGEPVFVANVPPKDEDDEKAAAALRDAEHQASAERTSHEAKHGTKAKHRA